MNEWMNECADLIGDSVLHSKCLKDVNKKMHFKSTLIAK